VSRPPAPDAPADVLAAALRQLLGPLARLALAHGLTHATLDELLKQALVAQADAALDGLPPHRRVSRITTATGIHRREVSRLVDVLREGADQQPPPARSHATELFAHWRSQPAYQDADGRPAELPRQGPAPSFESLAQAITRDVHPRSLLDELQRLGLARLDADTDRVRLLRDAFVPLGDGVRMLQVLGRNVGAHLAGAVDNVLHDAAAAQAGAAAAGAAGVAAPAGAAPHFEQAIFATELSPASLDAFRDLVTAQWQATLQRLVPALEAMVEADAAAPAAVRAGFQQVRLGLYTHARPMPPAPAAPPAPPAPPAAAAGPVPPQEDPSDAPDPAV
jgi:hypothetical protein